MKSTVEFSYCFLCCCFVSLQHRDCAKKASFHMVMVLRIFRFSPKKRRNQCQSNEITQLRQQLTEKRRLGNKPFLRRSYWSPSFISTCKENIIKKGGEIRGKAQGIKLSEGCLEQASERIAPSGI